MATALALSNPNSLMRILNAIFIGIIVYVVINRYSYIVNVIIYAIAKSVIPILTTLIFSRIIGISIEVGLGSILILCIPNFILGLLIIKVIERISDWFDNDTIIYFIIIFSIIESIVSWIFSLFLGLFI